MAYNHRNKLLLIKDIQDIYKAHSAKYDGEANDKYVYENYIEPVYHISVACFYNYLGVNAKGMLTKLRSKKNEK